MGTAIYRDLRGLTIWAILPETPCRDYYNFISTKIVILLIKKSGQQPSLSELVIVRVSANGHSRLCLLTFARSSPPGCCSLPRARSMFVRKSFLIECVQLIMCCPWWHLVFGHHDHHEVAEPESEVMFAGLLIMSSISLWSYLRRLDRLDTPELCAGGGPSPSLI